MRLPDFCHDIAFAITEDVASVIFCIFASSFHLCMAFVIYSPGFPAGVSLFTCNEKPRDV